jgi:hypothetical protein
MDAEPTDKERNLAGRVNMRESQCNMMRWPDYELNDNETKIIDYIKRKGPSSKAAIYEHFKSEMSKAVFERTWKSLLDGAWIWRYAEGTDLFDLIPRNRI